MFVSIWERLGIEATTDIAAIQSAYASKTKECHPEERPEEFQELQKAYKQAVRYAKSGKKMGGTIPVSEGPVLERPEGGTSSPKEKEDLADKEPEAERTPPEFDYSGVEREEARSRFFEQMRYIALNPFLRNNLECWELFLKQPEFEPLFHEDSFRKNIVLTMCYWLSGWQRGTIRYFDKQLKNFQKDMQKPETELRCWKKKRNALLEKDLWSFPFWSASKEQKQIHEMLLKQVNYLLGNDALQNPDILEKYLKLYLAFAAGNSVRIENLHECRKTMRYMITGFLLAAVFWIFLSLHMYAWYQKNPPENRNVSVSRNAADQEFF